MNDWQLEEAIAYYQERGAPRDQQELIALLREAQQERGGALPESDLAAIAQACGITRSFLTALIRHLPDLRVQDAPRVLELCGSVACRRNGSDALGAFLRREYGARPGQASARGNFEWRVAGCLKQCGKGPCARWNGVTCTRVDEAKLRELIES